MAAVRWLLVLAVAVLAAWAWWPRLGHGHTKAAETAARALYVCPMHPQIVADLPGECPICHMDLVVSARAEHGEEHATEDAVPAGTQAIRLAPDRIQAIGVHTSLALAQVVTPTAVATGRVLAPESGRAEVHVRAPSFIEKVLVAETGTFVRKGEALALIYSPEIIAMQGEVLAAGQWADPAARHAVRQRLGLYGLADGEIDALFRAGKPQRLLTLRAPADGVVTERAAVPGGYAMPETALYILQNLTPLWLEVAVPEALLATLQAGLTVEARAEAQTAPVMAVLDRLLPQVDAERLTGTARFVLREPPQWLRPGAWLRVALPSEPPHLAVVVPRDALLETGALPYVYVAEGDGWFVPRAVEPGPLLGEAIEIRRGLDAGERVVSSAAFLIDAESRLQAGVRALDAAATPTAAGGGQP